MAFARMVWKLLVAIKDGLALVFLLLFFFMLYALLTARPSPGLVHNGALLLKLDGSIVEEPHKIEPFKQLLSSEAPVTEYRARDIVAALRAAAHDDRIKAVVFDLTRFTGGGLVHMLEIGHAIDEVRAAHKPVLTYAVGYADDGLTIAAHASEAWVNPLGGAFVMGPGGNHLYYARLLDKLKVTAHVFRVGTFKSAVEPFMRNDQSPEARDAAQALYGALWEDWKADVARVRPKANLALVSTDPAGWLKSYGGDTAKASQGAGLVDRIGNDVEFGKRVAAIVGPDDSDDLPGKFAHTGLRAWLAANKPGSHGKAIGVVTIAGEIVDGKEGPGTAGGDRIAKLLDDALDDKLAALVVRIDSPGGSVLASERIREAIERYKARGIPVVVSMANLAASGGYWVSTPGSRVFAEPATITGSIGIFAVVPTFEKALGEIGVHSDGVRTTPLSGQPDLTGGLTPEVSAMIQSNIENGYARFVALVAKARGRTPAQIDAIGQGRVWDGGTARQIGLVDQFGGLDDALAYAAQQAHLGKDGWHAKFLGADYDPYSSLIERLRGDDDDDASEAAGANADWAAMAAQRQLDLASQALADAERILSARGAQAYCLECPLPAPHRSAKLPEAGLMARLAHLFGLI